MDIKDFMAVPFDKRNVALDEWEENSAEHNAFIKELIAKAKDIQNFADLYLDKDTAKANNYYKSYRYQRFLKIYASYYGDALWNYYREMFGDKCKHTESDAGALKIGNKGFSVLYKNGYGDGTMRYAVFEDKKAFYGDEMRYEGQFEGDDIHIYSYDCGDDINETLPAGKYQVFSYRGLVAIVKI